jgi:hypothetical protein
MATHVDFYFYLTGIECHWGSNPAKDDGISRAIKIRNTTSFGKILWHVKERCGTGQRYFVSKIQGHFSPRSPCFASRYVSW